MVTAPDRGPLPIRKGSAPRIALWLLGAVLVIGWAAPFLWMVSTSLKPSGQIMTRDIEWIPRTFTLDNYVQVFRQPVGRWLLNSVVVSFIATGVSLLTGAMAGYAFARLNFPGRQALFFLVLATIMIPQEMTIVPLFIGFLRAGMVDNYAAFILPAIANAISVYLFRQFFLALPREMEDAARIDGAGPFRLFFSIALPLARPATVAAAILVFTANWNAFLWPLLVAFSERMKTLPVGMAAFSPGIGGQTQIDSFGPAMAAMTLLTIPSLVVFILLQRHFIEGVSNVGVKG